MQNATSVINGKDDICILAYYQNYILRFVAYQLVSV